MVERYRRGKRKKKLLLGSHQKSWIWGRNVIWETLQAGRWPMVELRLAERLPDEALSAAEKLAARRNIPVVIESAERLTQLCHSAEHQGYVAKMGPYPYVSPEELLESPIVDPVYAILDSIQDPYNFGAIARSASVLGLSGLFIATHRQVGVTSLVARTSAGAVNHLSIARVENLPALARQLQLRGTTVLGTRQQAEQTLLECDLRRPVAIVLGNEGIGISEDLLQACDQTVRIPQSGPIDSLNAATSAGILFYEARRQRLSTDASNRKAME